MIFVVGVADFVTLQMPGHSLAVVRKDQAEAGLMCSQTSSTGRRVGLVDHQKCCMFAVEAGSNCQTDPYLWLDLTG